MGLTNTSIPLITLEQWRCLRAVVECGGYAQAAHQLRKSQSAITYAIQKIESLLNIKLFELQGRKSVLTATGHMLHRRAQALLEEAQQLERATQQLSVGWEAEIRLAVEVLFPNTWLLNSLCAFGEESPNTHIEVIESVLGGAPDALIQGQVDLAISPYIPAGFSGDPLARLRLIPVAHPDHPLHQHDDLLSYHDLRHYRHLVVRDSGQQRTRHTTTVEANQRWTVTHITTSIEAVKQGYGFAWLPEARIQDELATKQLKILPMREGKERWVELYLILADPDLAGSGTRRLAQLLHESVHQ